MERMDQMERDDYYVFLPEYPKLEMLRRFILRGEVQPALDYFRSENLDPNAYIKGVRNGTWVPLLYQCLQDNRFTPFIKVLLNRGGNIHLKPDAAEPQTPLIYICADLYLDFLVKRGLKPEPTSKAQDLYHCFLYAKHSRVKKLLGHGLLNPSDIQALEKAYPELVHHMLDTGVKYLTYFYGAQVKKSQSGKGDATANLKTVTEDMLARYVDLLHYTREPPTQAVADFCADYYLYEILAFYATRGDPLIARPVYGKTGATEALLRPLLNDYRYEQTCRVLKVAPEASIYQSYSRI